MKASQNNHGAHVGSRESGRPVSSVVAARHRSSKSATLQELGESIREVFWDVDREGDLTLTRPLPPLRQTLLPPSPDSPPQRPLWQVGIVLPSEELAELWVHQGHLSEETAFVWSDCQHSWVPLNAVPELQSAIIQAQRQYAERSSQARPLFLPLPPIEFGSGPVLHARTQLPLKYARHIHTLSERLQDFLTTLLAWTGHARILVSRDFTWSQRRRAIVAISRHRGAQGLAVTFVLAIVSGAAWPRSLKETHGAATLSREKQRETLIAQPESFPAGNRGSSAPASEIVSIESLPLVTKVSTKTSPVRYWRPTSSLVKPMQMTLSSDAEPVSNGGHLPFDATAARKALDYVASRTRHCTNSDVSGSVLVTFQPLGSVQDVSLTSITGDVKPKSCILGLFRTARVTPFSGGPVTVKKSFRASH